MDDQTAASGSPVKNTTVLVVDDDAQTLEVVREALPDSAIEILSAATAEEAKRILAEHTPALIILNVVLPDADGRSVLSELRQEARTAGVPVFVLFGFWGTQPRDECLRLGANEILEKSLDVSQLGDKLSRALDRATATDRDSRLDTITGLPNRASLADAYGRETAGAQMAGRQVTVALLDLDDLATINEQHGQAVGDLVLKNVGSRLVAALRDTAVVTRWEDDNFAILFPETDLQTAVAAVTKAQAEVAASPMVEEGDATVSISFSAGVTTVPAEASLGEAIARADGILLRARAQGPSRVLSSEDNAPASKPTLLVAEDDRVAAALVRHRLERAGFEVLHRANGAEALKTALDNTISLFVLDIRMPGMDGIELLKRLRESEQYSRTPILMLTSLGREEDIVRAFKLGASDYLTKPFSPVELLARVQRLLRRGGLTE